MFHVLAEQTCGNRLGLWLDPGQTSPALSLSAPLCLLQGWTTGSRVFKGSVVWAWGSPRPSPGPCTVSTTSQER